MTRSPFSNFALITPAVAPFEVRMIFAEPLSVRDTAVFSAISDLRSAAEASKPSDTTEYSEIFFPPSVREARSFPLLEMYS